MSEFLTDLKRSHDCGSLRAADVGKRVVLFGWVASRRDHGGCVFIDLRDRGGFTQIVFEPSVNQEAHTLAGELRSEFCIGDHRHGGRPRRRPQPQDADRRDRGPLRSAHHLLAVRDARPSTSRTTPRPTRPLRLKHRALDLRRPSLQRNFLVRSAIYQTTRRVLTEQGVPRDRDPLHGQVHPGRRPQLPGPLAAQPRARSTRWPSRPRSSSSSSWWRASTATSRSSAASATRTCAWIASPSSPRSTSR